MNIQRLRYFIRVAEHRNFSKAAEDFYIAQSAMSQQIQRLEQELDATLFQRNAKETVLTKAGCIFLEDAKKIVALYDEALIRLQKQKQQQRFRLNISYLGLYERAILPDLLHVFSEKHPNIELNLYGSAGQRLELDLEQGRTDIAIGFPYEFANKKKKYDFCILDTDDISIALSINHPLSNKDSLHLDDLLQETIYMVSRMDSPKNFERLESDLDSIHFHPKRIASVESFDALLLMVESGAGAAFVPSNVVKINSLNLKLFPLKNWGVHFEHLVAAIFRKNHNNPSITLFLNEAMTFFSSRS